MKVLVLAAGIPDDAALVQSGGYPILLAETGGRLLVEHIVAACEPAKASDIIFLVREEDGRRYHLGNVIAQVAPNGAMVMVRGKTAGAACTAMLAVQYIDPEQELLILNGNETLDVDFAEVLADFRNRQLDAGTLVFPSLHPRYSYVKLGTDALVIEAAEKNPISRDATAGFYWWRRGADFIACVQSMIRKDAHVGGAYYICPAFNEMILRDGRVGVQKIKIGQFRPVKSQRQLDRLEERS